MDFNLKGNLLDQKFSRQNFYKIGFKIGLVLALVFCLVDKEESCLSFFANVTPATSVDPHPSLYITYRGAWWSDHLCSRFLKKKSSFALWWQTFKSMILVYVENLSIWCKCFSLILDLFVELLNQLRTAWSCANVNLSEPNIFFSLIFGNKCRKKSPKNKVCQQ